MACGVAADVVTTVLWLELSRNPKKMKRFVVFHNQTAWGGRMKAYSKRVFQHSTVYACGRLAFHFHFSHARTLIMITLMFYMSTYIVELISAFCANVRRTRFSTSPPRTHTHTHAYLLRCCLRIVSMNPFWWRLFRTYVYKGKSLCGTRKHRTRAVCTMNAYFRGSSVCGSKTSGTSINSTADGTYFCVSPHKSFFFLTLFSFLLRPWSQEERKSWIGRFRWHKF